MNRFAAVATALIASSLVLTGCSQPSAASLGMCTASSMTSNLNANRAAGAQVTITVAPVKKLGFPLAELLKSRTDAVCDAMVTETFVSQGGQELKFETVLFRGSLNSLDKSVAAAITPRGWIHSTGDGVHFTSYEDPGNRNEGATVEAIKGKGTYVEVSVTG